MLLCLYAHVVMGSFFFLNVAFLIIKFLVIIFVFRTHPRDWLGREGFVDESKPVCDDAPCKSPFQSPESGQIAGDSESQTAESARKTVDAVYAVLAESLGRGESPKPGSEIMGNRQDYWPTVAGFAGGAEKRIR